MLAAATASALLRIGFPHAGEALHGHNNHTGDVGVKQMVRPVCSPASSEMDEVPDAYVVAIEGASIVLRVLRGG